MEAVNPAEAREEAAANLEKLILASAADMLMSQVTSEFNTLLERLGVEYRAPADEPRLTDVVIDLGYTHNEQCKRDVGMLPDDGGIWAAAVRLNARAVEVMQHRIVQAALEQHVRAVELDLVKAVSEYRELNQRGAKHLGADVEDWIPSPETAALFGLGVAQ